jgi:hypothetical protein
MKILSLFAMLLCLMLTGMSCAINNSLSSAGGKMEPGNTQHLGYPVDVQSSLIMLEGYKWWPEMSGYYLPAGIYKAESEDANGVFFKAPDGLKLLSLTGSTDVKGGIYLPKLSTTGVSGHVYLWMPGLGWTSYLLPQYFFWRYGNTWEIKKSKEPINH